jgi:hypothetical protein
MELPAPFDRENDLAKFASACMVLRATTVIFKSELELEGILRNCKHRNLKRKTEGEDERCGQMRRTVERAMFDICQQ